MNVPKPPLWKLILAVIVYWPIWLLDKTAMIIFLPVILLAAALFCAWASYQIGLLVGNYWNDLLLTLCVTGTLLLLGCLYTWASKVLNRNK